MLNLEKNEVLTLDLKKEKTRKINIGIGWDTRLDLDVHAMSRDAKGQVIDTVYYGRLNSKGIKLSGDNLNGEGAGDDETIFIDMNNLPRSVSFISIYVNVFSAGKSFNNVDGGFMRIYNPDTQEEYGISKLNMKELKNQKCVHYVEIDTRGEELKFKVILDSDITMHNLSKRHRVIDFASNINNKKEIPKKKKKFFGLF